MTDGSGGGTKAEGPEWFWKLLLPFSPTKGRDQVKTSMKFGSQYGCGEQLNCLMFITLFSYFRTAADGDTEDALEF